MCLVRLDSLSLFLPGDKTRKPVLHDLSWELAPNSHYGLTGANGVGKSTLLRLLHGELWPASGRITWQSDTGPDDSPIIGRKISRLVSPAIQARIQHLGWNYKVKSLLANASEPESNIPDPSAPLPAAAINLMADWNATSLLELSLCDLSQGQLRLVLLAQAILAQAPLLLLDEWSDGLDAASRKRISATLAGIAAKTAMVFASHRRAGLPDWLDAQFCLRDGRLFPAEPLQDRAANTATPPMAPLPRGPVLMELRNVSVIRQGKTLLRNINWQLRAGEHWRISGPNGAGKSTFLRLLAGDEFAYAGGEIIIRSASTGKKLQSLPEKRCAISLVSDLGEACYSYGLTALELVLSGFENSVGVYREYEPAEQAWAEQLIIRFLGEDSGILTRSIRALSTGQLRRLFLARALACRPEILLLDEPCTGLDPESRTMFLALLTDLAHGKIAGLDPALIFVSHESEAPSCINRWAEMQNGELIITPLQATGNLFGD